MLFPVKRGFGGLGVPAGVDAEFVGAFQRWEQLQAAAAAQNSSSSAAAPILAGSSKGFADGMKAWLSPQLAIQELGSGFRNLDSMNVAYFGGLLAVPLGVLLVLRRR